MGKRRIIDFHTHLGDIFHENKNITFKTNIRRPQPDYDDYFGRLERAGFIHLAAHFGNNKDKRRELVDSGQIRAWDATLENASHDMTRFGVDYMVALPVWPNTTFEEYLAASKLDERIIPFTSADFSLTIPEMCKKLELDIERGAKGLKLHPILQNVRLSDPRVGAVTKLFGERGIPIITHTGTGAYYVDKPYICPPEYGEMEDFYAYAKKFPDYVLIAAHAAENTDSFKAGIGDLPNVYIDSTGCSGKEIRYAADVLGVDKVLYGTDFPFFSLGASIRQVEEAFADDEDAMDRVFYRNAATLLGMPL